MPTRPSTTTTTTAPPCAPIDEQWHMVQSHEADPLLDLVAQRCIDISDLRCSSIPDSNEEFSLVELQRPSFAQVAALQGAAREACARPVASVVVAAAAAASPVSSAFTGTGRAAMTGCGNKYGTDYILKKSGKKYIAVKA